MTETKLLLLILCSMYSTVRGDICYAFPNITTNCILDNETRIEPGDVVQDGDLVSFILPVKGKIMKELTVNFPNGDLKCLIEPPAEGACTGDFIEVDVTGEGANDRKCEWRCTEKGTTTYEFRLEISQAESGEVEFDNIRFGGTGEEGIPDPESYIFDLIVAVAPEEIIMDELDEWEYDPNNPTKTGRAKCRAMYTRPQPELHWSIGDGSMEIDADLTNRTETVTEFPGGDHYFPGEGMIFEQTLELTIEPWMDGLNLTCTANHTAYVGARQNNTASRIMVVKGPPVPRNETIDVQGTFTEGEGGILRIPFHSFPAPISLMFDMNGEEANITVDATGNSTTAGRFTNLGWVAQEDENITSRSTNDPRQFYAKLEISEVEEGDAGLVHRMTVTNNLGSSTYTFTIPTVEDGGLSDGEIAGIVIGCLAAVVLVAGAAVMFVRHRNGKKSKKIKQERKRKRNEERQSEDNSGFHNVELEQQ